MARTVVYDQGNRGADGYASKLAKYVPVEVITLATSFFAVFQVGRGWVYFWLAVATVANAVYLVAIGVQQPPETRPENYFYVLATFAFLFWAAATIDAVATTFGLSGGTGAGQRAFVLAFAALFIPAVDSLFSSDPLKEWLVKARLRRA
ncbi:hypothetical protein ACIB24_00180 [Spongisporangium articulatum]|uniref:Uncharacterized protein n=1 Tax=Spongisporangium articulatum TaxID=3362603 RepID=A0ABW8AHH3_9ACTN